MVYRRFLADRTFYRRAYYIRFVGDDKIFIAYSAERQNWQHRIVIV